MGNTLSNQIDNIASEWLDFLKESHQFKMANDHELRVNTPFVDPFGDSIALMITQSGTSYTVSDQGYTIWNLSVNGANLTDKQSNRFRIMRSILSKNSVSISQTDHEIYKVGSRQDISQLINDVTQAVIQVSGLSYSNRSNTREMFLDDVNSYFNSNKDSFSYLTGMFLQGQSQLKYKIDFIFNLTVKHRKFANVYHSLSKSLVEQLIGIWSDTLEYRNSQGNNNVPLNIIIPKIDSKQQQFADSLSRHDIEVIPFENKDKLKEALGIKSLR